MRLLLTGGTGFIGSHIARHFVQRGDEVHLLSRSSYSQRLIGLERTIYFHLCDIRDAHAVKKTVETAQPELVIHAAAALPGRDQAEIWTVNLDGTRNLLNAIADHECRLIHLGSSSEYGLWDIPMATDLVCRPLGAYGQSKLLATQLAVQRGAVIRVFSAYGPWEEPNRLASQVFRAIRQCQRPCVGTGKAPRDWIYVTDVVDLIERVSQTDQFRGEILNAGTGRDQTTGELISTAVHVAGWTGGVQVSHHHDRDGEPVRWVADIARTFHLTGWTPKTSLTNGLTAMWHIINMRNAS